MAISIIAIFIIGLTSLGLYAWALVIDDRNMAKLGLFLGIIGISLTTLPIFLVMFRRCPYYGVILLATQRYCYKCQLSFRNGVPEEPADQTEKIIKVFTKKCPSCGEMVPRRHVSCDKCGMKFDI